MYVVATAGHVDHGKSALVQALTGQQPDRLEEERRRGLSIDLGYCWASLDGVGQVAFVDVPGHERFLATTLSGLGPVPAVLFVVAADDPWMPQAAEHLAALDALGVTHGVVAVTRADLTDPRPAMARAARQTAGTALDGAPVVAVSARTGDGMDRLREAVVTMVRSLPPPDPAADVRLWLDRHFHVAGAGTVVTGTLPAGTITVGDRLHVDGDPEAVVRVRRIQCLGESVETVHGVARTALDLGGRTPAELGRGSALVAADAFASADVVDVRLSGEGQPPERPLLHIGATSISVHLRPLDGDLVRLTLQRRLPLRVGDRAVLRDPGSRRLWGVRVLDPAPPPLARRGAALRRAESLRSADGSTADELHRRGIVRRSLLRRIGVDAAALPPDAVAAGDWVVSGPRAAELRATLLDRVVQSMALPLPGLAPAEATHLLGLPDDRLVTVLARTPLRLDSGRLVTEAGPSLPEALLVAVQRLEEGLADSPFAAPTAERLRELDLDARAIAVLARAGLVLRLADAVVLLPGADILALQRLRELPQPFTTSQARQALPTSRRVAIPLLDHLDRTGRTTRLPDDTRRCR